MQVILKNDLSKSIKYYVDNNYSIIGARLVSLLDFKETKCVIAYKDKNFSQLNGRLDCIFTNGDTYILNFEDEYYGSNIQVFECLDIVKINS